MVLMEARSRHAPTRHGDGRHEPRGYDTIHSLVIPREKFCGNNLSAATECNDGAREKSTMG